ncbi:MAG TPA: hypothetical protein PLX20_15195, partial [Rhodocyclaceae bacterium]|nr:hypothetical protein [Rhodocyclaceae bacterium]HNA05173.1 hypothetical protein [Rhodocyclaceae bacterium]HNB78550.1 hypothetical protein [Rhodocyclaceae bacterium]HNH14482.1 hypothetical protein [Rhodocyclaceae bacterium]
MGNLVATFGYLAHAALPEEKRRNFVPNLSYAISAVRTTLPRLLLRLRNPVATLRRLLDLIARTLEWRRPHRSFPRSRQAVKPTRHRAYKPV